MESRFSLDGRFRSPFSKSLVPSVCVRRETDGVWGDLTLHKTPCWCDSVTPPKTPSLWTSVLLYPRLRLRTQTPPPVSRQPLPPDPGTGCLQAVGPSPRVPSGLWILHRLRGHEPKGPETSPSASHTEDLTPLYLPRVHLVSGPVHVSYVPRSSPPASHVRLLLRPVSTCLLVGDSRHPSCVTTNFLLLGYLKVLPFDLSNLGTQNAPPADSLLTRFSPYPAATGEATESYDCSLCRRRLYKEGSSQRILF